MESITLSAHAKINLTLSITGKREDGYHTLESVMQEISLADTVKVETIPCGIAIFCNRPGIPTDEKNLCYKAAKLYFDAAERMGGVKIDLIKCIPDGAGMGGGSSDAAAVLKALHQLYPAPVNLPEIALRVGADVPFFLMGKTALCQGIGEVLTPLTFSGKEALFCVVAKTCPGLSTPEIYGRFDSLCSEKPLSPSAAQWEDALEKGDMKTFFSLMQNDLELPAITLRPEIARCKEALLSLKADAAMMTGSGSAVFGLFFQEKAARGAVLALNKAGAEAHFCTLI